MHPDFEIWIQMSAVILTKEECKIHSVHHNIYVFYLLAMHTEPLTQVAMTPPASRRQGHEHLAAMSQMAMLCAQGRTATATASGEHLGGTPRP